MKYLGSKFSVHMPGAKAQYWPKRIDDPAPGKLVVCSKCGSLIDDQPFTRPHTHGADLLRPRHRICFG